MSIFLVLVSTFRDFFCLYILPVCICSTFDNFKYNILLFSIILKAECRGTAVTNFCLSVPRSETISRSIALAYGLQERPGREATLVAQAPVEWAVPVPVPAAAVPAWSVLQAAVGPVLETLLQTPVPTWVEHTVTATCLQVQQSGFGIQK